MEKIGDSAFARSGLTSVAIPNSVSWIGNEVFTGCPSLTSISVAPDNTYFDSRENCNAIIRTSDNALIVGCRSTSIPGSVETIGKTAFYECYGLTSVAIPNSVTSIGKRAFECCFDLTSVTIPNSVTTIGDMAFYSCLDLSSVAIPNSVTSIGEGTYGYCSGLTSVTIGNSVTSIGKEAFFSCSGLTSVTIPNSVTSIGGFAFALCSGLTSIIIGDSVTSIDSRAFIKCSNLENVYCLPETVPSTSTNVFENVPVANATLHVPATAVSAYQTTDPWSTFGTIKALDASGINSISLSGIAIRTSAGNITISGLGNNEKVAFYSPKGISLGTVKATGGTVTFSAMPGSIVLARIGKETVKIMVD